MSRSLLRSFFVCVVLVLCGALLANASTFTPLAWQQVVRKHRIRAFVGQRKHTTWIRDQNRNFIDDEIERRFHSGQNVNIIVDLNTCLPNRRIEELLGKFGHVKYVEKFITAVLVDRVSFDDLPKIAALPEVAMVEWQEVGRIMNDVSTRAVQARASKTYSPNTAEDHGFTGTGINVAIVDTGVDDTHEAFKGKFVAGFDATSSTDPGNGTNHPGDDNGHGTHVAGTALGLETAGRNCRTPDDGSPNNCGGVAPGAGLVVIKVCDAFGSCANIAQGLDWLGSHAAAFKVRVANMSLGNCTDDDGTSAMAQQVNYLVAIGVVMSVAHGNSPNCGVSAGTKLTGSPASASFAITVNASDDQGTVSRKDDTIASNFYMTGPRKDFNMASPDLLALKPDITAPGGRFQPPAGTDNPAFDIWSACSGSAAASFTQCVGTSTTEYHPDSGTSMATPHVTGAAADILQARPDMDPASLKDLILRAADTSRNFTLGGATFPAVDPVWNSGFGYGLLNVWNAINTAAATDVGFPSCVAPPATPGGICTLAPPNPPWENTVDITTAAPPVTNAANTITAQIKNFGTVPATVLVNFGVYELAVGNNQFFHLGTVQVTIAPGATVPVQQAWTPGAPSHQCIQVGIEYGLDTNYGNNLTQRNESVSASAYDIRVENPYMVPARFEVVSRSRSEKWKCEAGESSFNLAPFECPRMVRVNFTAPKGTKEGEQQACEIAVFATAEKSEKRQLIGGVTVHTVVPAPCQFIGTVVGPAGEPLSDAHLIFEMDDPEVDKSTSPKPVELTTGPGGALAATLYPYRTYRVLVERAGIGRGEFKFKGLCGLCIRIVLTREGASLAEEKE